MNLLSNQVWKSIDLIFLPGTLDRKVQTLNVDDLSWCEKEEEVVASLLRRREEQDSVK